MTEKAGEIKGKLDDVVDSLDDILEENAANFVESFVQRGGE